MVLTPLFRAGVSSHWELLEKLLLETDVVHCLVTLTHGFWKSDHKYFHIQFENTNFPAGRVRFGIFFNPKEFIVGLVKMLPKQ